MYVCVCRGITDSQVLEAVCKGAKSAKDVNQCIGIPIQCGKCCSFMKEVVQQAVATVISKD